MAALGPYLRELRERRGLSLEEVARATRVATRYLEALEADDFRSLPAPAFTRGFIRAWCQAVGADPAEALARYQPYPGGEYARAPAVPAVEHEHAAAGPGRSRNQGAVLVSFVLLVVLGVALFAVTLMLQAGRDQTVRRVEVEPPRPAAGAPSASPGDQVVRPGPIPRKSTPADVVPDVVGPAAGGQGLTAPGEPTALYRLVARVSEPTWIRVRTADGRTTQETIPAGEVREWQSSEPFVLTVGNAGGVTLELNGRALPPLGESGAVIQRLVVPQPGQ